MLAGRVKGKNQFIQYVRGCRSYSAGKMTAEEVEEYENKVCASCGSCSGMYTATP